MIRKAHSAKAGTAQIILALDVDNLKKAKRFVEILYPEVKIFKVGSQLFTACGPEAVRMIGEKGGQVFLDLKFHSSRSAANNETRYANAEVDKLLEQARAEPDLQKRVVLYQQAEDIILNDVPWIPLFHGKSSLLVKPYLCGYFPTPMGVSVLRYAYFCG